jgi:hypothetical protein
MCFCFKKTVVPQTGKISNINDSVKIRQIDKQTFAIWST